MIARRAERTAELLQERQVGKLPDLPGIVVDEIADGAVRLSMRVETRHLAPNGFLHAARVIALADTAAGYGGFAHLPDGATGFTTIELKSNFVSSVLDGRIVARASLVHGGRTTQLWDAVVATDAGRSLALFRCTRLVLWPRNRRARHDGRLDARSPTRDTSNPS